MTRINVVEPSELSRQHLVAEYRELPRVFGLVRAAIARGELPTDPRNPVAYCLGSGHCRFFYPRLGYLFRRQQELIREMRERGYQPQHDCQGLLEGIPAQWCADWLPDQTALEINRARIDERNNG